MGNSLHDVITEAFSQARCVPVTFEKPLKSVSVLVRLKKTLAPENIVARHAVIGWGLGNLTEHFGKTLFRIKSVHLVNEKAAVKIEAVVLISGLTFEEDHEAFLDGLIGWYVGQNYKQYGYYWNPKWFKWDSAEKISDVYCFKQVDGSGKLEALGEKEQP